MKVFVTGATGFVGHEIVRHLRAAGHSPRILVRNPERNRVHRISSASNAELHVGDVLAPDSLSAGLQGVDAVIHLVGVISEFGRCTFENIHINGTRNVVAAARQAGVGRFIHMSALGTRPAAVSRYHQSKWAAEETVRQSGLQHTIFRPSLIYGPEDHFVNLFAKISRLSPVVPLLGRNTTRFQPVPVQTVATAFTGALIQPASITQTYDLCGKEVLTLRQIVDAILEVTRRKRLKLQIPNSLARAQAAFLEWLFPAILRRPPPLNRDQILMLQEDNTGEPEPANKLFKLNPITFREGIASYLSKADRSPITQTSMP
jgi:NADH dehydrogenase